MTSPDGMLSVEEARERILAHCHVLEPEERGLLDVRGQVLSEDVYAPFDVPMVANSAMDGYAVRAEDAAGAAPERPVVLPVAGQVAAGYTAGGPLRPGSAIRIMTGAPIPEGADSVVPFEDTDELERRRSGAASASIKEIGVRTAPVPGANVRPAGEDVRKGALVLPAGTVLRAAHIGVLASLGTPRVRVVRRPVVAILTTGDELREPGEPLAEGQIYNSNSYTTAVQVMDCGAIPMILPTARDTVEDLTDKIRQGLDDADLFVTSAGVSTGEYDLVKDVLGHQGSMDFWRVRMRPGKPLAFGLLRRPDGTAVPHLGLPGNPVSSMVAFDQFVRPALEKLMGKSATGHAVVSAVLEEPVDNGDGRRFFARGRIDKREGRYYARLTGPQGSNVLTSMAQANGLIIVPEDRTRVEAGEEVQVQILDGYEYLLA